MNELRPCNKLIYDSLDGDAAIQALVGGPSGRIFPSLAPQDAEFPHIIYALHSSPQTIAVGQGESVQAMPRYQIKSVTSGEEMLDVGHQIADAVDAVLSGIFGTIVDIGGGSFYIGRIVKENAIDLTVVDSGVRYDYIGGIYRLTVCRV